MTAKVIVKPILESTPIPKQPYKQLFLWSLPQPLSHCLQTSPLLQCFRQLICGVFSLKSRKIGIIVAMQEEIRPLLKVVGSFLEKRLSRFTTYSFAVAGHEIIAVVSGMGPVNGTAATRLLVEHHHPELLIHAGFAGGITTGVEVGYIVLAHRVFTYENSEFQEQQGINVGLAVHAAELLEPDIKIRLLAGTFVSAAGITSKAHLAIALPPFSPVAVVEMETAAVIRVATEADTPLIAMRAISDGADEELGFTIEEITDSALQVRLGKVLITMARKPWIIPQLMRLAQNSRLAGVNLAAASEGLLEKL